MRSFKRLLLPALGSALYLAAPCLAMGADEGEKVFQDSCTECHNAKTRPLDNIRLTRDKWKEAIDRMEGVGTEVPGGKKLAALLDYLERTHGPDSPAPDKK